MKVDRLISIAMILTLLATLTPASAFAQEEELPVQTQQEEAADDTNHLQPVRENQNLQEQGTMESADSADEEEETAVIEEIADLPETIAKQTLSIRSGEKAELPETLSVRLKNSDRFFDINVEWRTEEEVSTDKIGTFSYTAVIKDYLLADQVSLPVIQVEVVRAATEISGLQTSLTKKSRTPLTNTITLSPAYGRTVKLQMKKSGKWVTKESFRLEDSDKGTLKLTYPTDWWKTTSSLWRVVVPASEEGTKLVSPEITISTKRYYQNPAGYLQLQDEIALKGSGGYNLKSGYMGLKTLKVNNYFKIGNKNWPRYTAETKAKVKAFQKKKGLKATGIVNKKTWLAMGFSEQEWTALSAYVSPIKVNPSSTKKQHIEAMIRTAKTYLGTSYVVGASGKPGQGADCSGLVMQAMYAAGADPYPVSPIRHAKAGYEYESRNIWKLKGLKTIPYTKKQRGDLIFYKGRSGAINHIAIYLGGGKVIESWPNKVVIKPVRNKQRSQIYGVKRVFN